MDNSSPTTEEEAMSAHTRHHESHGNHPMSVLAYLLVLSGFAFAALWLVNMATSNVGAAILFGILMVAAFAGAATIFMTLTHQHHHSPILPDNTDNELRHYEERYRR